MDCDDLWAETVRKVRIAAIFAGKLLLEAIFGVVLRGWGALSEYGAKWGTYLPQNGGLIYPKIYGKVYGKIYGNPTTHLGAEIRKIVGNHRK